MDKEQEERILEELKSSQKFVSMQTALLSLGLATLAMGSTYISMNNDMWIGYVYVIMGVICLVFFGYSLLKNSK
ncbi:MAG: hypothetical protein ACLFUH_06400 [Bacteroidales bacterium]